MITLTANAIKKAKALMEKENKVGHYLRVGVQGGGCSGFSYHLDFVYLFNEDDTVYTLDGINVICDPKSLRFLDGMEIDYSNNLMDSGFKFNNPNSKKACSCGESFSV